MEAILEPRNRFLLFGDCIGIGTTQSPKLLCVDYRTILDNLISFQIEMKVGLDRNIIFNSIRYRFV